MQKLEQLKEFLYKAAKTTYASWDNSLKKKEDDWSTTFFYEDGLRSYHDNYVGGEPFGGREIVFYDKKPYFIMTYYGRVVPESGFLLHENGLETVYKFLQKSLTLVPKEYPYRWPRFYELDNFLYKNDFEWEVNNFHGIESISYQGIKVYETRYVGGLVDQ